LEVTGSILGTPGLMVQFLQVLQIPSVLVCSKHSFYPIRGVAHTIDIVSLNSKSSYVYTHWLSRYEWVAFEYNVTVC